MIILVNRLQITILIFLLQLSFSWDLTLSIYDTNDEAANDYLQLGTCEGCHDGFHYGEDGYDIPTGVTPYTDIQFFHLDWLGNSIWDPAEEYTDENSNGIYDEGEEFADTNDNNIWDPAEEYTDENSNGIYDEGEEFIDLGLGDENGNHCDSPEFAVDIRSTHLPSDLLEWKIRGATVGHNSPLEFTWEMDDLSDEYEIFLYVGDQGYNLRLLESISITPTDLFALYEWIDINEDGIQQFNEWFSADNIRILLGGCASTGTSSYYIDNDQDGFGSGPSFEFCPTFEPDGYVNNNNDQNDTIYCLSNNIDDCDICDGENSDMDCVEECFGNAFIDDCGECSEGTSGHLENSDMDCAEECFGNAFIDDCGECNGENQTCLDEIFSHIPYNLHALIEDSSISISWNFDLSLDDSVIQGFNIYHGNDETSINQIATTSNTYFNTDQFSSGTFCVSIFDTYNNESDIICTIASEYHSFFYDLHVGANLLSFPYIPEDSSIENIFSPIQEVSNGIIGEGEACIFDEGSNQWVGGMTEINHYSGYWIKIKTELDIQSISFHVLGFPLQVEEIYYQLNDGYNLISYIEADSVLVEAAIPSEFYNNITKIIGEGEACIFNEGANQWVGSLNYLKYGSGYWIETNEEINFYWENP